MLCPNPSLVVGPLLLGAAWNCPHPVVRQREKRAWLLPQHEGVGGGRGSSLRELILHSFKEKTEEKKTGNKD